MSGRLSRAVDRARAVEAELPTLNDEQSASALLELEILWRRVGLSNWSIWLCVFAALLVCLLVVGMFSASLTSLPMGVVVESLFIASLLFLIASLGAFMLEINLATRTLRTRREVHSKLTR